jgi:hypothetical protein
VAAAPLVTEMVAALVFDETAVRATQAPVAEIRVATSESAENFDCTSPMAEIWALTFFAWLERLLRGCFSNATNLVTMLSTSSPLPIPVDEMVAMAASKINQTAKIMATNR